MTSSDEVKNRIQSLFQANRTIHVSAVFGEPKSTIENEPAAIKGVYPHLFQLKDLKTGEKHTFAYADVLTKQVIIRELDEQ